MLSPASQLNNLGAGIAHLGDGAITVAGLKDRPRRMAFSTALTLKRVSGRRALCF
jgi:hypothetical protein